MKLHLPKQTDTLLLQMAKESGLSKSDLVEIAVDNLIALWAKAKHEKDFIVPFDAHDGDHVAG